MVLFNSKWTQISQAITNATQQKFEITSSRSVSGGCINQGYQVRNGNQVYFVKLNQAHQVEMFAAEALGLKQMWATQTITVPRPICWGMADDASYIVLQWLELGGGSSQGWRAMGQQLAALHCQGTAERFGWERNNTIGSTPQINTWRKCWADFFAEERIGYQLRLANRRGGGFGTEVIEVIRDRLAVRQPQPSLVHGDLWSGNADLAGNGDPVIFDPAAYYGDRETDIAMTELFGGFPKTFYEGYNQAWPLDAGYRERKQIYNLYHVLNHFNLFGGGYGNQAQRIIKQLL